MSDDNWRFDVENAPRGRFEEAVGPKRSKRSVFKPEPVIIACSDGKTVTLSRWMPEEGRWNMISKKEHVVAWQPWPSYPKGIA